MQKKNKKNPKSKPRKVCPYTGRKMKGFRTYHPKICQLGNLIILN